MSRSTPSAIQPVDRFFQFSLLGLLASGYFAVVGSGYLDLPTTVLTGLALLLRALMLSGAVKVKIPGRLVAAATIAYLGFYPIDYLYLSQGFLPATVHLVCFLAAAKILTANTNRDFFFVKVIALLELLAAAVLSSNLSFFAFLALFLVMGVSTFAASEIRRSGGAGRRVSRSSHSLAWRLSALTVCTATGILVLTAGLFFLLPRTARAAFRHLVPERYHIAGFSNEIELGQLGEIRQSGTPVMHVRIDGINHGLPVKWRGSALARFDGRRWFNPPLRGEPMRPEQSMLRVANDKQQRRRGARISYEVALQSIDTDTLFFAGVPEFVRIAVPLVYRMPSDSFRTGLGYGEGVRYFAYSYLPQDGIGTNIYDPDPLLPQLRQEYLQLPKVDPRIADLTRRLTLHAATDYDAARVIETHLRTQYGYTTQLLDAKVPDPLATFLFDRKKGHCEYFASAMAVMLREMGIPARVATGFQSGTFNPLTGWQVIRTSDAHSWVEAYLERRGWVTFDPTPPDPSPLASNVWTRFNMVLDAADTFWREWVLSYDRERQFDLALKIDSSTRNASFTWWRDAEDEARRIGERVASDARLYGKPVVLVIVCGVLVALALPRLRAVLEWRLHHARVSRGEVHAHDATVLYNRMLSALRRRGYEKPPWLTPSEFARVLPETAAPALVDEITAAYYELRFGGEKAAAMRMLALIAQLETQPAK